MGVINKTILLSHKIIVDFFRVGGVSHAASLAYVTLLSLVPLMILGFNVLTIFPLFFGLQEKIQQFIFTNFVASSAQMILGHVKVFITQTQHLSVLGMIFLLITSAFMIFSMEQTFNQIWRVPKHRNVFHAITMYLAVLLFAPFLLGIGFIASSYLINFKLFFGITMVTNEEAIFAVFPYLFTFSAFFLVYIIVPNCQVEMRHAAIGAAIATIFFEIAKYSFAIYIKIFPFYQLLYGAFSIIPIFLIWLYVSWLIVLFGAVVSHNVAKKLITVGPQ